MLVSSDLQWNSHVDKIAKKGNSILASVKRNLYACSEETKQAAYVSLVRPHLEYVTAVWDPYRQNQVEKVEAVQSHAVGFIKHDYDHNTSVSKLKKSLPLELLSDRRKSHRIQNFHKSVYNDIAFLFRLIINCLLGKQEITRQTHLFNHLYITTAISIVSSQELCLLSETRALNYSAFCRAKLL